MIEFIVNMSVVQGCVFAAGVWSSSWLVRLGWREIVEAASPVALPRRARSGHVTPANRRTARPPCSCESP